MTTITLSEGITLTATKATIEKVEEAKKLFDHYRELLNNGCPEEWKYWEYVDELGYILDKANHLLGFANWLDFE